MRRPRRTPSLPASVHPLFVDAPVHLIFPDTVSASTPIALPHNWYVKGPLFIVSVQNGAVVSPSLISTSTPGLGAGGAVSAHLARCAS